MGLMDSLINTGLDAAKSKLSGQGAIHSGGLDLASLASIASALLQQSGGITGVVSKLQNAGLGDIAASWMGSEANLSLSGEQVQQAFGADTIANLAQGTGSTGDGLAAQLANILPGLIDQLTPNGKIQSGGMPDLGAISGTLSRFMA